MNEIFINFYFIKIRVFFFVQFILPSRVNKKKMSGEDRISALHDDLLLKILSEIPTKDVVTTMVLSKRWRFVWTKVHKLEYKDTRKEGNSRV